MPEIGQRVIAFRDATEGIVSSYGEGEYLGDKIPSEGMLADLEIKNPCIKLDNGKYVWGFQCWWGSLDGFNKQLEKGTYKSVVEVELEQEVLPKEE